ncbi:MAG: hypothetical protein QM346_08425 [Chloroflexota bacterium]|nr:hypothetical protein [Chloroflexota bacterium]
MTRNGTVDALYRVQARLNELHDSHGMSWRVIAQRAEFSDLSHATLRDIAETARASAKTRRASRH